MRDVPLGADAVSLLEGRDHKGDYIFLGEGGKKYTNDYVSRRFKAYVREAGLPEEIHFHRLRDTYCTWLADKNVPIHVIKALAGHSSVRVTEGYLSTNTEAMKSEVEKIKLPGMRSSGENEKP
jgi:integrase/recombinase XerD